MSAVVVDVYLKPQERSDQFAVAADSFGVFIRLSVGQLGFLIHLSTMLGYKFFFAVLRRKIARANGHV